MPLRHWWVLAQPQLLGATNNKNGGLDSEKVLRGNQDFGSD